MKDPKTEKGKRMYRKILDATKVLIEEKGYIEIRISDITDKAGISDGNFYRYFNNKGDVFKILLQEWLDEIFEVTNASGTKGTYLEKIEMSFRRLFLSINDVVSMYKAIKQVKVGDNEFKEFYIEMRKPFLSRIQLILDRHEFPEEFDKDIAAKALFSMLANFIDLYFIDEENFDNEENIESAVKTIAMLWTNAISSSAINKKDKKDRLVEKPEGYSDEHSNEKVVPLALKEEILMELLDTHPELAIKIIQNGYAPFLTKNNSVPSS
ncbi:TetR/AcrR family transcriptional regulator [Peribacillus frigoritolerans]|uniref:TetR/AcrR family transcriptional regulator n=1 Tax=Peribacillus frigoritolerans TaxID=450367 RepID=UPI0020BDCE11|nr:TetR/AcrR family transcriptional regulator [Peribacillus frigoritolerans]